MTLLKAAIGLVKNSLKRLSPTRRTRVRLSTTYLRGHGIEVGALHSPLPVSRRARVKYVDRLSRVDLLRHYPELADTGVVDPDIVDNGEELSSIEDGSLDFIIANHFIEHCENPIRTLQNFFAKLRPGGVVYMAVPDKRYNFDSQRPTTTFEHLVNDFIDNGAATRQAHYLEFTRFSHFKDRASAPEVSQLAGTWMKEAYSIHFHVWAYDDFLLFLNEVRKIYVPGLEVLVATRNQDEGIFLLRRQVQAS